MLLELLEIHVEVIETTRQNDQIWPFLEKCQIKWGTNHCADLNSASIYNS